MENAKKFFEEAMKTEEAKKVFDSIKKPETAEEVAKFYAEAAAKLGIELTVEEINAYIAEKTPTGEIDDEELSQLTGGSKGHEACESTYQNYENCWWSDACDIAFNYFPEYKDYRCSWHNE